MGREPAGKLEITGLNPVQGSSGCLTSTIHNMYMYMDMDVDIRNIHTGSNSQQTDHSWHTGWDVGGATELPSGGLLDAGTGEDL